MENTVENECLLTVLPLFSECEAEMGKLTSKFPTPALIGPSPTPDVKWKRYAPKQLNWTSQGFGDAQHGLITERSEVIGLPRLVRRGGSFKARSSCSRDGRKTTFYSATEKKVHSTSSPGRQLLSLDINGDLTEALESLGGLILDKGR